MPKFPNRAAARDHARYEEFVSLLVAHEPRVRAFLRSLMPAWADVDEVMQETSLVAWRKFDRFESGSSFLAWVLAIARFEALDHLRQRRRQAFVFSDAVLALMTNEAVADGDRWERERWALERCLDKLGHAQRELLLLAHQPGVRIRETAALAGRTTEGFYKSVQRLRARLLGCIRTELKEEPT